MARNFYEAGLNYIIANHWRMFTPGEQSVLTWLHKASQHSEQLYLDEIATVEYASELWYGIESIKTKCRSVPGLNILFKRLRDDFQAKVPNGVPDGAGAIGGS